MTHTNASRGCESKANYLWVSWEQDGDAYDDKDLGRAMVRWLSPVTPGGKRLVHRTDLAELETNAPRGDAYVELVFHDHQASQRWLHNRGKSWSHRYGMAVDNYLGYPS